MITTATDTQNVVALDNIAKEVNGWREELRHLVKVFNSYLANKDCVYFYQEKPWVSDLSEVEFSYTEDSDPALVCTATIPYTYFQVEKDGKIIAEV